MTVQNTETQSTEKGNGELDLNTMTQQEIEEALHSNVSLRAEWLHNPNAEKFKKFNDALNGVSSSDFSQGDGTQNGATQQNLEQGASSQGAAQTTTTDELVTIKIKPEMLGTYLVNRTPEQAFDEFVKGKKEADKYINVLKGNLNQANSQTVELRHLLDEATRKATTPQVQPQALSSVPAAEQKQTETPKINIEEIKGLDLFDPDNQKKFLDSFATVASELERLRSTPATQPQALPPEEPHKGSPSESVPQTQNTDNKAKLQTAFNQNELALMQELQYQFPQLATERPIIEIDREIANVYATMDRIAGAKNPNDGVALYLAQTPQGEQFRTQCAQAGVKLPDEYDQWYQIMSIREQRVNDLSSFAKTLSDRKGEQVSLYDVMDTPNHSYVDYFRRMNTGNGAQSSQLQTVIERHKASQNAATLPPGTVPEIPQDLSQIPASVENWTEDMILNFVNQKELSQFNPDEAVIYKDICKMMSVPVPPVIAAKIK